MLVGERVVCFLDLVEPEAVDVHQPLHPLLTALAGRGNDPVVAEVILCHRLAVAELAITRSTTSLAALPVSWATSGVPRERIRLHPTICPWPGDQ